MGGGPPNTQAITEQQVIATYRAMQSEIQQLVDKITELEMEVSEHSRVVTTLEPLDDNRKAFRMIGGVLVERTVADALPAVKGNQEGIQKVLEQLSKTLQEKEKEASEWQRKFNIQTRPANQ